MVDIAPLIKGMQSSLNYLVQGAIFRRSTDVQGSTLRQDIARNLTHRSILPSFTSPRGYRDDTSTIPSLNLQRTYKPPPPPPPLFQTLILLHPTKYSLHLSNVSLPRKIDMCIKGKERTRARIERGKRKGE
ncbi:PREDICTED: uncharacterized protein LOC105363736 [Ceratosolen solmsi marchali]|uniref:Uncharacterized protein LOC105363736 n=1 Tax=Ceratosolen solmsi marchali TaxID=326594 RepID=A0AAJ7DXA0_9HYME|nr:PREDICTED: uncharacterized protein LOC105363736 [Ceratosolen solmsi marchali]